MNYFIFYDKVCVAYTDNKHVVKAFIEKFNNKESFTVDKFKKIDKFYLEDQIIDDMTLYYHHDAGMFLNEGLVLELYEYSQTLNDELLNLVNGFDKLTAKIKLADNESYIITQFLLNFGVMIEDVEWMFYENIDVVDVLEKHVFLSMNEQFNRKE